MNLLEEEIKKPPGPMASSKRHLKNSLAYSHDPCNKITASLLIRKAWGDS
jgi:hypothetical protein